ncbi:MAG: MATE family efflux transporter [Bacteroidota bacterium]
MSNATANPLTQEILSESLWKLMVKFSLPAIIAMSINSVNTFVDALFIGQYVGQDALAAVSLAFPLVMITNGLASMIGIGASSLLSRAIGANQEQIQQRIFGVSTVLTVICSAVLMAVGLFFAEELIGLMGGTGEIQEMGAYYYRILLFGAFFRIYGVVLNVLIRAEGKIKEAMIYGIISTLLNIILNPLFIAYYEWGIAGAAWSTNVAMLLFTMIGVWYFVKRKANYDIDFTYWRLDKTMMRPILSVGVSAMMLQIMFVVQQIFVFRSIVHYGAGHPAPYDSDFHTALMGANYRIMILMIMPIFGFSQAFQPVAGINYGAEVYERVKSGFIIFTRASTIALLFLWILEMLFPEVILGWMLPDATFRSQDILNFRIQMCSYPVFPFFFMGITLFQSIGNAKTAGYMLVARELGLFVPFVLLLPYLYGVDGIYHAIAPTNFIVFVVTIFLIRKEFKKWEAKEVLVEEAIV